MLLLCSHNLSYKGNLFSISVSQKNPRRNVCRKSRNSPPALLKLQTSGRNLLLFQRKTLLQHQIQSFPFIRREARFSVKSGNRENNVVQVCSGIHPADGLSVTVGGTCGRGRKVIIRKCSRSMLKKKKLTQTVCYLFSSAFHSACRRVTV